MLTSDVAVDQLLLDLATVTKTIAAAPCCRHVVPQGHKTQIEKDIKFNFFPSLSKADSLGVTLSAVQAWSETMRRTHGTCSFKTSGSRRRHGWNAGLSLILDICIFSWALCQDTDKISDRIKKLEEKNKAAKKLQRQAALEHKKAEKSYKAGSDERHLFLCLWPHLLVCDDCGRHKPRQSEHITPKKKKQAPSATQTAGKGDKRGGQRGLEEGSERKASFAPPARSHWHRKIN